MTLFSSRRRTSHWTSFFIGVCGAIVGAGVAVLLSPSNGRDLRGRVRGLWSRTHDEEESIDRQLDRMTSEGGLMGADTTAGDDVHMPRG